MDITDKRIDEGKAFDWGKTSEFYAKYRDIYPDGDASDVRCPAPC